MIGEEEEAKDVLQESFIDAFTKISTLEHEVTFSAWLKRIVVNKCINALRKNRNHFSSLDEESDLQIPADTSSYDDSIVKKGAQEIMTALDRISEGCRTVFNLYLFEGYDHKEIGQILSISESASKAQYSKAKSKIRTLLENTEV
jgi:RNA polymerase sigma-70 factor (ECF subfamily)